jgi:ArsR family transcriptional regulator
MSKPAILDRMQVLSDPIRSRLLVLLQKAELTVSELCDVLQLPQSTVSRHLKVLGDDGWVTSRRDGTARHYSMAGAALSQEARELWLLVQGHLLSGPGGEQDARRLESVLSRRRERSRAFFDRTAGEWDATRDELFGVRAETGALFALLDEDWVVGDLGCGTGRATELLAPHVRRVVAVDASEAMLVEARDRLRGCENVELHRAELEELPIRDAELDAALLILVLHHIARPQEALAEVARVLSPGGKLVILDMVPHERSEYRTEMGHAWLGFAATELHDWLEQAGFTAVRHRLLPADPSAKGPLLFVATARIPKNTRRTESPVAASAVD